VEGGAGDQSADPSRDAGRMWTAGSEASPGCETGTRLVLEISMTKVPDTVSLPLRGSSPVIGAMRSAGVVGVVHDIFRRKECSESEGRFIS
jgi:hypothetical protein